MRLLPLFLAPTLVLSAGALRKPRRGGPVRSAREAKRIAEQDTGGRAVHVRSVPLNGASGGWEVDVHMAHEARGWRCVIDADTHMVHTKTRIENPPLPRR